MSAAFVIGGSGGLGSAICRALAAEWDHVVVGYRNGQDAAKETAAAIDGGVAMRCDVTDADSVSSSIADAAARFGGIGTVIFAGGVAIGQPFVSRIDEASWREVIETELIGFTRVVAAALPVFRRQQGGNFVSVVSVANYSYPPGDSLSSVPKAGIEALGRAIAKEEGRYGIRANMVAPGIIDAGLGAAFLQTLYSPEIWEAQKQRIALRRFGSGDEIAEAVSFLASDRALYITGQTLIVDGGFSL
ncbi:SDR family oxidoreductase [Sphingomonas sp. CGMCC 1.13654]|uniref:SDR family oxidoreductase n=1 Tax=Sphingomonas chungangi TaxID=2683589 RepID=A0A838L394_9SPHN|nr:SDR family oxidoreductase [Sphingomonas chungangi]MVW54986.1 SDR family oxidoreductase [Sphingomonas chungangi]